MTLTKFLLLLVLGSVTVACGQKGRLIVDKPIIDCAPTIVADNTDVAEVSSDDASSDAPVDTQAIDPDCEPVEKVTRSSSSELDRQSDGSPTIINR